MVSTKTIIIGAGPSLKRFNQLERLRDSKFDGKILIADFILKQALEYGITPDRFPDYTVFAIEDAMETIYCFQYPIVEKYGKQIHCVLNSVHPMVKEQCEKTFKSIQMVEDTETTNFLSNVGDITFYVAKEILRLDKVGVIGFNHAFSEIPRGFPQEVVELFWSKHLNPITEEPYYLNPIYEYYTETFKNYLEKSGHILYNLTEEGSLFGKNIVWSKLEDFINEP